MSWDTYMRTASLVVMLSLALGMSVLLDGIGRRIKARIQHRMGPPVLQTFYDLAKLLRTPSVVPGGWGFILAPVIAFSASLISVSILPLGLVSPISFSYDIFVYLYVLAMLSLAMMLAGFSVRNPYANIGANREMMVILSVEPVLGVGLACLALVTGRLDVEGIVSTAGLLSAKYLFFYVLTVLFIMTYAVYVECGFIPYDLAEAETEILEGPLVEYSGKLLGLFKWALLIKRFSLLWLLSTLIVAPLFTWCRGSILGCLMHSLLQLVMMVIIYSCMVAYEAMGPRYKVEWAIKNNLKVFILSIIYLVVVFTVIQL